MEKLIITAAICGAEVTKENNPNVPYTIEEIGREAEAAYNAGASIIHLHVREDDGTPTQSKERFRLAMEEIKRRCKDVIIQPSTGGAVGMSNEERLEPTLLKPEMATLDCGTCNFGGDDIFVNTENTIIEFAQQMLKLNIKPEIEVFDKGMIDLAIRLRKKGFLKDPMHFNFVMGVNGGIGASLRDFDFLMGSIPADSTATVAGIGRYEFSTAAMAIISGLHVRVGFEDNVYLEKGRLAKSNGELVEKASRIARDLGRAIATPKEARNILSI
ncbi:3-keto-5-aminohexanoate cleavage protein [Clostridium oryzae]|uniref:3-keto-5-aminohexanoate cleavage enzyme n=1 Tax=Clostridium oryzae TaxID=1450648 RepID=A0A1V4ICM5_9CLOT|nr:3-keto-5-aminohexanoate cleavage protein [Clostridium oryzae]OPJ57758.1 3-keto-5-aminohexanoate cleavage enzyme [Clostridium oryzae]